MADPVELPAGRVGNTACLLLLLQGLHRWVWRGDGAPSALTVGQWVRLLGGAAPAERACLILSVLWDWPMDRIAEWMGYDEPGQSRAVVYERYRRGRLKIRTPENLAVIQRVI